MSQQLRDDVIQARRDAGWMEDENGRWTKQEAASTITRFGAGDDEYVTKPYNPAFHDNESIRATPRGEVQESAPHNQDVLLKVRKIEARVAAETTRKAEAAQKMQTMPKDEKTRFINEQGLNTKLTHEELRQLRLFKANNAKGRAEQQAAQQEQRRAFGDAAAIQHLVRLMQTATPQELEVIRQAFERGEVANV